MKNSAFWLGPALLLGAGCTEILNIDVHYDDGGGGTGPSNGGNGASVSEGGSGAGSSDGGNGAGPSTGGNGGASMGGSSPYCTTADEFESGSEPDISNCWYSAQGGYVTTSIGDGELHVRPNGSGSTTGWYDANRGYYLFRHLLPGPFAAVTKVRVTNQADTGGPSAIAPNAYHVAGFVVRDPLAVGGERWVKLEVGYRADTAAFENHPFGTLAAVTANSNSDHVTPYDMDEDLTVELGVCRNQQDVIFLFVRNDEGGFFQQEQGPELNGFQITQGAEVGVTATAYTGPDNDIAGHFEYVRFAEDANIDTPADCQEIITSLAGHGPDEGCGCTSQAETN